MLGFGSPDNVLPLTKLYSFYNVFEMRRNLDPILSLFGNFVKNKTFSIKIVQLHSPPSIYLILSLGRKNPYKINQ